MVRNCDGPSLGLRIRLFSPGLETLLLIASFLLGVYVLAGGKGSTRTSVTLRRLLAFFRVSESNRDLTPTTAAAHLVPAACWITNLFVSSTFDCIER
jgi:hypothetical protein